MADNLALVQGWSIGCLTCYIGVVIGAGFFTRLFLAMLRAFEQVHQAVSANGYWSFVRANFWGTHPNDREKVHSDYWHPFILGLMELGMYPVFMASGSWTAIGAWITLKTLGQWTTWSTYRPAFNRFLIGNALNIIIAFLVLVPFVELAKK
jgi:hypothetical protein